MHKNKTIVAGDIGGTKSILAIYTVSDGLLQQQKLQRFNSSDYNNFQGLLNDFLPEVNNIISACFGIAGPVVNNACTATNLPWTIIGNEIKQQFNISKVQLLNDLEATAYGMLELREDEFIELNPDAVYQDGHIAILSAGTGLGEAIAFFDGKKHHAMPTEGGHSDFAPLDEQQDDLLRFLRKKYPQHVSYERLVCGNGFSEIYDFLKEVAFATADTDIENQMQQQDKNRVISQHGLTGDDALCRESLNLFCKIYGAESGNLALKCLPRGGVFLGGGIAPQIKEALKQGQFIQAFLGKGRMQKVLENIPVRLALNTDAPLLGAAKQALNLI